MDSKDLILELRQLRMGRRAEVKEPCGATAGSAHTYQKCRHWKLMTLVPVAQLSYSYAMQSSSLALSRRHIKRQWLAFDPS